eukprot:TRINITY_DN2866_c0_g1_i1.p1 TRINITY_DN2866_c0_g1~~TRINITY_DN2866_c0_g1_i1.p1  ORF type:complete len:649 (-),score=226.84 TRINITY_DN2866_c0_g1_i1:282-2228(-)
MSWLLNSLVGKGGIEESDDVVEGVGGGVREDLTELRQSFAKHLKGVTSFLTGEPDDDDDYEDENYDGEENDNDGENAEVNDGEQESDSGHHDIIGEACVHASQDIYSGHAVALASGLALEGGGEEHVQGDASPSIHDEKEPLMEVNIANIAPDNKGSSSHGEPAAHGANLKLSQERLSGIRRDMAELSDTLASSFSSVMRVVTGDDIVARSTTTWQQTPPSRPEYFHSSTERDASGSEVAVGKGKGTTADEDDEAEGGGLLQAAKEDLSALTGTIKIGFSGISKLATSILPFGLDDGSDGSDGDEGAGVGDDEGAHKLSDEVVAFANSIAIHPETWMDFPLPPEDEDGDDFILSPAQEDHVEAIEYAAPRLVALRLELTPVHMSESRFWKIYFVLIHSRLPPEQSALLSTPQVVEARNLVVENLKRQREGNEEEKLEEEKDEAGGDGAAERKKVEGVAVQENNGTVGEVEAAAGAQAQILEERRGELLAARGSVPPMEPLSESAMDDGKTLSAPAGSKHKNEAQVSTGAGAADKHLEAGSAKVGKNDEEAEADDWLDDDDADGGIAPATTSGADEDVSFSDLEDEEDEQEHDGRGGKSSSGAQSGEPASAPASASAPLTKKGKEDDGSSPSGSDKTEEWLTVDGDDSH